MVSAHLQVPVAGQILSSGAKVISSDWQNCKAGSLWPGTPVPWPAGPSHSLFLLPAAPGLCGTSGGVFQDHLVQAPDFRNEETEVQRGQNLPSHFPTGRGQAVPVLSTFCVPGADHTGLLGS